MLPKKEDTSLNALGQYPRADELLPLIKMNHYLKIYFIYFIWDFLNIQWRILVKGHEFISSRLLYRLNFNFKQLSLCSVLPWR